MNTKDLVERATDYLRAQGTKKPVTVPKRTFYISDGEGDAYKFKVKETNKTVGYNQDDVGAIVEACLIVAKEALRNGETISIRDFGSLGPHYRKARATKDPFYGKWVDVEARYVPKFTPGKGLKLAVKLWELSEKEKLAAEEETLEEAYAPNEDGGDE